MTKRGERNVSIKRQLMLAGLLTTGAALLCISVTLLVRGWLEGRGKMVDALATYAEVIALNAAPAMLFDDPQAAAGTLSALKAIPDIVFAALYDRNGRLFAVYAPGGGVAAELPPDGGGYRFMAGKLVLSRPVQFKGEKLGMIHLQSSLNRLYLEIVKNGALTFGAALAAFLAAALLFARLQKGIVGPIRDLAALMQTLSTEQNYSIRAPSYGKDEVGVLARIFNAMLAQIQARDNALQQHRAHLEQVVAERTAQLQESEEKFRTIFNKALEGILLADVETRHFQMANEKICAMLGYSLQEILHLGVRDIHPESDWPTIETQFEKQARGESGMADNIPVKRKDGSVFYAEIDAAPIQMGGQYYLLGMFRDVTERKRWEEEIRRLNEELEAKVRERTRQLLDAQDELLRKEKLAVLGQVAGSVGHELRNPLGVMSNAVYFLKMVLAEADETVQEYLGIIDNEIALSDRIVSDLLDSVRIKPPHPQVVRLRDLCDEVLQKCAIPERIAVRVAIPDTLPPVRVDPLQMQQVLRNLVGNAADAIADEGQLEIRAAEDSASRMLRIKVKDSGTGIEPENLAKLFQPLFTTKARGIGLGLVVVKNLTEANGGRIEVQSTPGEGSTFTVVLPADTGG